jgi:cobalamin synthase
LIYAIVIDKSAHSSAGTDFTAQATVYSLGLVITATLSGVLAQYLGYMFFFILCFVLQAVLLGLVYFFVRSEHLDGWEDEVDTGEEVVHA